RTRRAWPTTGPIAKAGHFGPIWFSSRAPYPSSSHGKAHIDLTSGRQLAARQGDSDAVASRRSRHSPNIRPDARPGEFNVVGPTPLAAPRASRVGDDSSGR